MFYLEVFSSLDQSLFVSSKQGNESQLKISLLDVKKDGFFQTERSILKSCLHDDHT